MSSFLQEGKMMRMKLKKEKVKEKNKKIQMYRAPKLAAMENLWLLQFTTKCLNLGVSI